MAKRKKAQQKPKAKPKQKAPLKRKRKASISTIGDIRRKMSVEGIESLTPAELRVVENIERMKTRRQSTPHTLAELEELASQGKITHAQVKELSELRQALEKKKRKVAYALFLVFENS